MDKQINPLAVIGRIPQQKASAVWNDTLSWGKKRCGSASEVFHLPHSSCSEALAHTHAQACCPPPMTTSWPHSSHLLLRPWLTCPPKRKISCPPPSNAHWSCSGPNVTWTDTYLNFSTCLCTEAAGAERCVSDKAEKVAALHADTRTLRGRAVGPWGFGTE